MPWKKSRFPLDALDISRAKHLGSFSPLFVIDWAYRLFSFQKNHMRILVSRIITS